MGVRETCIFLIKQGVNPKDAWIKAMAHCHPVDTRPKLLVPAFYTQAKPRNVDSLNWEPETWGKARVFHNVKGVTEQQGFSKSRHRHLKPKGRCESLGCFTERSSVDMGSFPMSCVSRVRGIEKG